MAVSTIIILTIALILLIGLIFFVTGGFNRFKDTTKPFSDTVQSSAIREACNLACTAEDSFAYCCTKHSLDDEEVTCMDDRFDVSCASLSCAAVSCPAE